MSHMTRIRTRLREAPAILEACRDLSWPADEDPATGAIVIQGRVRLQPGAEGFEMDVDYDDRHQASRQVQALMQRYAYHVARRKLEEQGFTLASEVRQEDGRLHLVMRRSG